MATLGPYRIVRPLGFGGMGEVHLAERSTAGGVERVALKLLAGPLPSPQLLERFATEATVRIAHPNVVEVIDAGSLEGRAYIALELLEGETLRARFERGSIPPAELAALGAQAAEGLHAVHEAGVVHRDVKPSNLFVTEDGTVKLIDFGVALVEHATRLTSAGAVPGTMGYLSPEQAGGQEATPRSDLWALGAVLYEGLSGEPPFLRPTPLATAIATLLEEPPPLSEAAPGCPPWLARTIERALDRDPEARFASAAAFAEALRGGAGAASSAPSRTPSLRPGERRVVAVLLAEGVRDRAAIEAAVTEAMGSVTTLAGGRLLGLFGAERWHGDELQRAATTALAIRPHADWVALASGWASSQRGAVEGAAITAVERALAEPLEGVAVDDATAGALGEGFSLRPVPDGDGVHELRDREQPAAAAPLPLVGREAELVQLRAALATAHNDRRAVLATVVGPPGIGKSRLLADFAAEVDAGVLEASASPRSQLEDYGWLRSLARLRAPAVDERLRQLAGGDLRLQRDRAHRLLSDWLRETFAESGGVLVLDDAHWSDEPSLDLIDELLDDADVPLLVLLASRDEHLFADRRPLSIAPRPLDRAGIATLASAVTGAALDAAALNDLAERTGGNPLFVLHCAAADGQSDARPLTIEAAVQIRLDALTEPERALCRAAAVFQRPFAVPELGLFEGIEPDRLPELVRRSLLVRRGRRRGRGGDVRYDFANRLVAEVVYESSTLERRRELHGRIAQLTADPSERAFHLERADQPRAAAEAHAIAAEAAVRRGDCGAALHATERALELGIGEAHHFELGMVRADALRFLGRRPEQLQALLGAADAAHSPADRARVHSELAVWHWRSGDRSTALAEAERAVTEATESDEPEAKVLAHGRLFLVEGSGERATAALAEATKYADLVGPGLRATLLAWEAHHHATTGALGKQLATYADLVETYDALGDLRRKAGAEANLADAYNRLGAYADAAEALEGALEACRVVRNRTLEGYALLNLGYARIALGDTEAGLEALASAGTLAEAQGEAALAAWVRLYRARALEPPEALRSMEALLSEPLEGLDAIRAAAAAVAARAALALGDVDTADAHSASALRLLRELGSIQEDEPAIYRARIELLRVRGQRTEAERLEAELEARIAERAAGIEDPVLRAQFLDRDSC